MRVKDCNVTFRLSQKELELLQSLAKEKGLSVSAYILQMCVYIEAKRKK